MAKLTDIAKLHKLMVAFNEYIDLYQRNRNSEAHTSVLRTLSRIKKYNSVVYILYMRKAKQAGITE